MLPIHYVLFLPPTVIGGYYVGRKIKNIFKITKYKWLYWALYWLLLFSLVLTLSTPIIAFVYSIALFLLFDFLFWIAKKNHFRKFETFIHLAYVRGLTVFVLAILFTAYGVYSAQNPILTHYNVFIHKEMKQNLKIILLSDLHLGTGTNQKTIDKIVQDVTDEKADIFLIAGDLYDERTSQELITYAIEHLGKAKTKYGTYYVEGNHDLLNPELTKQFHKNKIRTLQDEVLLIDNAFYLIGRKDKKHQRKSLSALTKQVHSAYPVILLDHRPEDETIAQKEKIDLQLAGHTHAGQLFPGNLFLKYGYYKKEDFHLIVSTGYGNWGTPVRTYTKNEMVEIKMKSLSKK